MTREKAKVQKNPHQQAEEKPMDVAVGIVVVVVGAISAVATFILLGAVMVTLAIVTIIVVCVVTAAQVSIALQTMMLHCNIPCSCIRHYQSAILRKKMMFNCSSMFLVLTWSLQQYLEQANKNKASRSSGGNKFIVFKPSEIDAAVSKRAKWLRGTATYNVYRSDFDGMDIATTVPKGTLPEWILMQEFHQAVSFVEHITFSALCSNISSSNTTKSD